MRRVGTVGALVLLLLTGCTGRPEPGTSPLGPPATVLGDLAGVTDTGASDWVQGLASDGAEVVGVGRVLGQRSSPTFRLSTDSGLTWTEGALDAASLQQTPLGSSEHPTEVRHAPGSATGWVAVGSESRGVSWTSADGRVWTRHELPSAVLDPAADELDGLAAGEGGYLAVGEHTDATDTTPVVWTSADGVSWARVALPGTGAATGVALRGRVAVAVGLTRGDQQDARAWRSVDGGRTWSTVPVPRPPRDGGFTRVLEEVTATTEGFTAVGSAWTDDWEPTLYRSADGSGWTYDRSVRSAGRGVHALGVHLAPTDDTVLVSRTIGRFARPRLWSRAGDGWQAARTPLEGQPRSSANFWVDSLARTSAGWVVAVEQESNGRLLGQLWWSADGRTFVAVDQPASRATVPFAAAADLALPGGRPTAVGRSRGLPVVWRLDPAASGPAVPVPLEREPRYAVDGAVAAGGQLLAWGTDLGGNSRYATVWTSTDEQTFRRSRAGSFGTYNAYGYSEITAVRRIGARWIAVGEQSTNGTDEHGALLATSADGVRWTAGRPAHVSTSVFGETGAALSDLVGTPGRLRRAQDVTRAGSRTFAVGWSGRDGAERPTTWSLHEDERGRQVWSLATFSRGGFAGGQLTSVQSRGTHVVALGSVRRRGSPTWLPYVWVSEDSGVSWHGSLLPLGDVDPARLELSRLVRTGAAYVVVGEVTTDVGRVVAWRSADGTTWERFGLAGVPAGPGESLDVVGVSSAGDDLVALLETQTVAGRGTTVVRQAVR